MIKEEQNVKLDNFEGPIDLLLHLIREKKLDILELSLVEVADQYIKYIDEAQKVNLDLASEYLVIASTLVELKAKNMLKATTKVESDDYESETEDLLKKLVEYEKYKVASESLLDIYKSNPRFEKEDNEYNEFFKEETDVEVELKSNGKSDIIDAYYNIQARIKELKPLSTKIINTRISPEQRKEEIKEFLSNVEETTFLDLIESDDRYYIAVSLLVVLELSNSGNIKIRQNETMDNIEIEVLK